ncbi:glycoside hydrolase family 55 protein [Streptomyces cavernae]|uniref:glycoside hydrolase family 55 protein n=1 Tax=Streptomyces cavernae TaxID=2259034 RepID=UPI001EE49D8A|nr:glycoside hydrolase family 55 protein [Streptomyces cavernae]
MIDGRNCDVPGFSRRGLLGASLAAAAVAMTDGAAVAGSRTPATTAATTTTATTTTDATTTVATGAASGAGAGRVPALWREFSRTPFTHPQIPYVGRAGCRGGATRFPRRPAVIDLASYGARPDGSADTAPLINRAIAAAGRAGGGTVLIPPGTFRIDGVIRVGHSNVVLKGAGSGRTKLYATKHLTELIGPYGSRYGGTKSSWSWSGGLIWLAPTARWNSLVAAIKAQDWPFEGWTGNRRDEWETLTAVGPATRGSWSVRVASSRRLRPGALVLLRLSDDTSHTLLQHMSGGGPGPAAYPWKKHTKLLSYVPYEWPVRITHVQGRTVTFERPLPLDLRPEWNPQLTTHVEALTGSGVEGLTLEAVLSPQQPHLLDLGYNGVTFQCAYDCWADDVVVRNVDNGFGLVAASACTLRRTRVTGRGEHHPYFCREGSHDNLIDGFTIEERTVPAPAGTQLHGINVEGLSSYNVWTRGDMRMGTFDSHRGLPFANVRTDITVDNNGRHGGDAVSGPLFGARFTHWNIRATNGRAGLVKIDGLAPYSATVGLNACTEFDQIDVPDFTGDLHSRLELYPTTDVVRPRNLYDAQRELTR